MEVEVDYRVHKGPRLEPILSPLSKQKSFKLELNNILIRLGLLNYLPSEFPTNILIIISCLFHVPYASRISHCL